mgnify:CR=1 FL=1
MKTFLRHRSLVAGASVVALLVTLALAQAILERRVDAQAKGAVMAPRFEVDPLWPRPLPNPRVPGLVGNASGKETGGVSGGAVYVKNKHT